MNWAVTYYNERVKREVFALPAGILASYLHLLELVQEFGANLCMPHPRAMGDGRSSCARGAEKAAGACSIARMRTGRSSSCVPS